MEKELISKREYFSAKLMADYLEYDFVEEKDLIAFTYDGNRRRKDNRTNKEYIRFP